MSEATIDSIADAMFEMVKSTHGKKNLKPMDVTKAMIEQFGDDKCDKKLCKAAIKELINSGRCVYTYFGGSYVEIPHREASAND